MLINIKYTFLLSTLLLLGVQCSKIKKEKDEQTETDQDRLKRDISFSSPIYYDQAPQPVKPKPPQNLIQGLPIVGALVSNVPGLNGVTSTVTTLVPLGNLGSDGNLAGLVNLGGLGNLGNLGGLGGLGGLGNLGNLGGLGGTLGGLNNLGGLVGTGQQHQCPAAHVMKCRCESLSNINPIGGKAQDGLEILQQNMKLNQNGDKEISARLSNGLIFYQRSGIEKLSNNQDSKVVQGYYTLQIKDNKYLTIYYTITDLDYTVKADVTAEPPKNDLNESTTVTEY